MAFKNDEFVCVVHMAHGASGSGASPEDALPIVSGPLFSVMEGVVITDAQLHVDVAVVGATALEIGDGVDPDGYITNANAVIGTIGVKVGSGALLNAKKYAAGDTVDVAVTGASSAGNMIAVLRGYRV